MDFEFTDVVSSVHGLVIFVYFAPIGNFLGIGKNGKLDLFKAKDLAKMCDNLISRYMEDHEFF